MKASRDQLKALLKEILIEILSEGLGSVQPGAVRPPAPGRPPIVGSMQEQRQANGRRKPQYDSRLDTPIGGRTATDALKETIMRQAGGNPIMQDILADTAMTTLPSQMGGEAPSGPTRDHAPNQQEQFHGDPSEMFGGAGQMRDDGSSHWADLAFGGPGKKSA